MVQKVSYKVLNQMDNLEIRRYPSIVLAVVKDLNEDEAFNLLFRFISGENKGKDKIEMTAPVISTSDCMAFVLPSKFTIDTALEPLNPQVKLKKTRSRDLAVIRFRGRSENEDVEKKTKELLSILRKNNLKTMGKALLMRYNPPFIPGFFRRNEVAIEVKF
jgi:hypothetical protein